MASLCPQDKVHILWCNLQDLLWPSLCRFSCSLPYPLRQVLWTSLSSPNFSYLTLIFCLAQSYSLSALCSFNPSPEELPHAPCCLHHVLLYAVPRAVCLPIVAHSVVLCLVILPTGMSAPWGQDLYGVCMYPGAWHMELLTWMSMAVSGWISGLLWILWVSSLWG